MWTPSGRGIGVELPDGNLVCLVTFSINIPHEQKFQCQRNSHRGSQEDHVKYTQISIPCGTRKQTCAHPWERG